MKTKKYVGLTDGVINGQPYESDTEMKILENGELVGDIIIRKLPDNFNPACLSLSNSSQKIGPMTNTKPGLPNIYDFLKGQGTIISSRIYTYPDYPDASLSQIGIAELDADGISYKNTINGYTGSLPTDIIEIKPYFQKITKREEGGMQLKASTIIVSKSKGEIRTEILGTYTFKGETEIPYEYNVEHSPKFEIIGENYFESKNKIKEPMIIRMSQFVINK
mgnify:FL=1